MIASIFTNGVNTKEQTLKVERLIKRMIRNKHIKILKPIVKWIESY